MEKEQLEGNDLENVIGNLNPDEWLPILKWEKADFRKIEQIIVMSFKKDPSQMVTIKDKAVAYIENYRKVEVDRDIYLYLKHQDRWGYEQFFEVVCVNFNKMIVERFFLMYQKATGDVDQVTYDIGSFPWEDEKEGDADFHDRRIPGRVKTVSVKPTSIATIISGKNERKMEI